MKRKKIAQGTESEKSARRESKAKRCFVIAPIGEPNSDIRRRSDQVKKYILQPIVAEICGYEMLRADDISDPGTITSQVIVHLAEDEVVIADLTGWNPNVFYELAIRHAARKPVIQLIHLNERIPFDLVQTRTIFFDYRDLDSVERCKEDLEKQIRSVEADPTRIDNPITVAINIQGASESEDPVQRTNAEVLRQLSAIGMQVRALSSEIETFRSAQTVMGLPSSQYNALGLLGASTYVYTPPAGTMYIDPSHASIFSDNFASGKNRVLSALAKRRAPQTQATPEKSDAFQKAHADADTSEKKEEPK